MFAAIDVGSFALELGIYEISDKGIKSIDHVRHMIALGSDTFSEGKISYGLADELCRVLEKFTETMKLYRVKDYRAYATTAMREAKNSRIILDQIRVRTGLEVHIISNSEQRFISYKAVASKAGEFNQIIQKGTAIVDVGFGSAQISLFDKDSLVATQNMPLGSLRLRSQLSKIPVSVEGNRLHIEEIVDNELITFRKMYLRDRQITNLIGIGDNILYLMRRLGIKGGESHVDAETMHVFYDKLSQMTINQIEENFGVNSDYANLLLPAAAVYTRILDITGAEMFWIPAIGICDGIAAEYASDKSHAAEVYHHYDTHSRPAHRVWNNTDIRGTAYCNSAPPSSRPPALQSSRSRRNSPPSRFHRSSDIPHLRQYRTSSHLRHTSNAPVMYGQYTCRHNVRVPSRHPESYNPSAAASASPCATVHGSIRYPPAAHPAPDNQPDKRSTPALSRADFPV